MLFERNNILFVGGIHGVGKSTFCKEFCEQSGAHYLSASEVINAGKISQKDKRVSDIESNQNALLDGLDKIVQKNQCYLLDGHFTLLNKKGEVERVPEAVFAKIRPLLILLLIDNPKEIQKRLEQRDGISYKLALLENLQKEESEYATRLSSQLGIDLLIENITSDKKEMLKRWKSKVTP